MDAKIHVASKVEGKDVGALVATICLLALTNVLAEQKKLLARTKEKSKLHQIRTLGETLSNAIELL